MNKKYSHSLISEILKAPDSMKDIVFCQVNTTKDLATLKHPFRIKLIECKNAIAIAMLKIIIYLAKKSSDTILNGKEKRIEYEEAKFKMEPLTSCCKA